VDAAVDLWDPARADTPQGLTREAPPSDEADVRAREIL
jgi:hypothetical protein